LDLKIKGPALAGPFSWCFERRYFAGFWKSKVKRSLSPMAVYLALRATGAQKKANRATSPVFGRAR
jgi:hypothetical protein